MIHKIQYAIGSDNFAKRGSGLTRTQIILAPPGSYYVFFAMYELPFRKVFSEQGKTPIDFFEFTRRERWCGKRNLIFVIDHHVMEMVDRHQSTYLEYLDATTFHNSRDSHILIPDWRINQTGSDFGC